VCGLLVRRARARARACLCVCVCCAFAARFLARSACGRFCPAAAGSPARAAPVARAHHARTHRARARASFAQGASAIVSEFKQSFVSLTTPRVCFRRGGGRGNRPPQHRSRLFPSPVARTRARTMAAPRLVLLLLLLLLAALVAGRAGAESYVLIKVSSTPPPRKTPERAVPHANPPANTLNTHTHQHRAAPSSTTTAPSARTC